LTLPNFLIIGAAKSGTTALYQFLLEHPEIYMSPDKEPHYFALSRKTITFTGPGSDYLNSRIRTLSEYERLFADVTNERAVGEASTQYLYFPWTALNIRHHLPDVKLIAILRNPVDRAYSAYLHRVKRGLEQLSFEDALADEAVRMRQNWDPVSFYKEGGLYARQLERYLQLFDASQLKVLTYEEFKSHPQAVLEELFTFLGVDPSFVPSLDRTFNASSMPTNAVAAKTLHWLNHPSRSKKLLRSALPLTARRRLTESALETIRSRFMAKAPLKPETINTLRLEYAPEVRKLDRMLGGRGLLSRWQIQVSGDHDPMNVEAL
jgi:hypothetical protein